MVLFRSLAGLGAGMLCAGAYATRVTTTTVHCKSTATIIKKEDDNDLVSPILSDTVGGITAPTSSCSDADDHLIHAVKEDDWKRTWGVPWVWDWDGPGKRNGVKRRSTDIRRQVILIRHGQYQNEKNSDAQDVDSAKTLTPMGEKQAVVTGAYLWKLFKDSHSTSAIEGNIKEPTSFYVSDMTRAQQTMHIILMSFPKKYRSSLTTDPILREKFPCDPQPYSKSKRANQVDSMACEEAFNRYIHRPLSDESTCDVVVCHANIIRYFLCRTLQIPPEAWLRFSLPHCSLTSVVVYGTGNVKVSYMGSAFHLEPSLQSTRNL